MTVEPAIRQMAISSGLRTSRTNGRLARSEQGLELRRRDLVDRGAAGRPRFGSAPRTPQNSW